MRKNIETWLLEDAVRQPPPESFAISKKQIKNILGVYQSATNRFSAEQADTLKVFEEQGQIYTRLNSGHALRLVPVNEQHFRRENQPVATISIVKDSSGATILQGDVGNFKRVN